ncbi:MAG TPA: DNA-3-methyladenine glycosylase [Bacillales bacterium]|nr:DNA-3-methyladenine glycosylase [Bacillales bacterium]
MNQDFFNRPTLELCKRLLGAQLCHQTPKGTITGNIVEVEAYCGPEDRAAHSYGGRRTKRTEVMFGPAGHAYLYIIYGIHICLNIVSGPPGKPEAILIRALEPTQGIETMIGNRKISVPRDTEGKWNINRLKQLTNGPGKLTKALDIPLSLYGHDLTRPPLDVRPLAEPLPEGGISSGPRIGIDNTGEARHYPWRFWIKGNRFVSKV